MRRSPPQISFIFDISVQAEAIWVWIACKDGSRPPSAKRLDTRGEGALTAGNNPPDRAPPTGTMDQCALNICPCCKLLISDILPARARPSSADDFGRPCKDGTCESNPARLDGGGERTFAGGAGALL